MSDETQTTPDGRELHVSPITEYIDKALTDSYITGKPDPANEEVREGAMAKYAAAGVTLDDVYHFHLEHAGPLMRSALALSGAPMDPLLTMLLGGPSVVVMDAHDISAMCMGMVVTGITAERLYVAAQGSSPRVEVNRARIIHYAKTAMRRNQEILDVLGEGKTDQERIVDGG